MSSGPHIFFNEVNERQGMFHRRAFLMGGVIGAGVLTLSGRLMQLQLVEAGRYRSMSEGNQFNYRLIPPPRGRILDRHGVELASNRPSFRLLVSRDEVQDIEATLDAVGQLIAIAPERRKQLLKEFAQSSRFVPVAIADDLTFIHSIWTPQVTPDPADILLHTGFQLAGRPAAGAWVNYALGTDNSNMPAYVVMKSQFQAAGVGATAVMASVTRTTCSSVIPCHIGSDSSRS